MCELRICYLNKQKHPPLFRSIWKVTVFMPREASTEFWSWESRHLFFFYWRKSIFSSPTCKMSREKQSFSKVMPKSFCLYDWRQLKTASFRVSSVQLRKNCILHGKKLPKALCQFDMAQILTEIGIPLYTILVAMKRFSRKYFLIKFLYMVHIRLR